MTKELLRKTMMVVVSQNIEIIVMLSLSFSQHICQVARM